MADLMFLCNMCGAEFEFAYRGLMNPTIKQEKPSFCPNCGREENKNAERRTTFNRIEILDDDEVEEVPDNAIAGTCVSAKIKEGD